MNKSNKPQNDVISYDEKELARTKRKMTGCFVAAFLPIVSVVLFIVFFV